MYFYWRVREIWLDLFGLLHGYMLDCRASTCHDQQAVSIITTTFCDYGSSNTRALS